jgi:ribose 5-phosphate isomerase B
MTSEAIAIASDHGGVRLKAVLSEHLNGLGFQVLDLGTNGDDSVDYPDFGYALAKAISEERVKQGVLVCGSGIGISIAANRHKAVRAALVHDALGASLARRHNDANVICFGERTTGFDVALDCLDVFLKTAFEGGRHAARVEKLSTP